MSGRSAHALLNEYKGYIFEFLVAKSLRTHFGLEAIEKVLTESDFKMLAQQESFVRNNYPELLLKLPSLAASTAEELTVSLDGKDVENILLSGKQNTSLSVNQFSEEDIGIFFKNNERLEISLKLAKEGIATNTKSSGLRSFFSRYFDAENLQKQFDEFVDIEFENMARRLHEIEEVEYSSDFCNWKDAGLPELPGGLVGESSSCLKAYYETLAGKVAHLLEEVDAEKLQNGLTSLAGFSGKNILQVICFYKNNYELSRIFIKKQMRLPEEFSWDHKKSTIVFGFDQIDLHLRIKPMNVFTTKSYKINAAVDFRPQA